MKAVWATLGCALVFAAQLAACNADVAQVPKADDVPSDAAAPEFASREDLLDPKSCEACHRSQYQEWAGSMHAYAAEDPVFIAMNARGQQETDGQLGTFCVNCHAPLAVSEKLTKDGLNLAELEPKYRGVTCYFCHNVEAVEGRHNNPLRLANDSTMRGSLSKPFPNRAHASSDSPHFDPGRPEASALCGSCHDVTLPESLVGREIALERTYAEWQETIFARSSAEGGVGCLGCHMPPSASRERAADVDGAPKRRSARHDLEGIDLALTPFPNSERQRLLVERFLASSLLTEICVSEIGAIEVTVENAGSGHGWPSGATHDRQAWLEVRAFDADGGKPLFETLDPAVAGKEPGGQAQVLELRDRVVDAQGERAHMFWEVRAVEMRGGIPGVSTRDPLAEGYHRERRIWTLNTESSDLTPIQRVTLKIRIRPIASDVLADLVDSGHLAQSVADSIPVIDVLPNRCYTSAEVQLFPDILGRRGECKDAAAGEFTLVWERSRAKREQRTFRESRIEGVPALCLSHPTYVSVPSAR